MLDPRVGPLARHILETITDRLHAIEEIDAAIKDGRPKDFPIEGKSRIHLHDRSHGYELTGFLHHNGYQIDETRVFLQQTNFPVSVILRWDADLAEGWLKAARLIDVDSMIHRQVEGYRIMQDEGYTVFHLEDWDRSAAMTWSQLKASISETEKAS